MNSGVLQFSLGLATGGFLSGLNSTVGKLTGFIGGMVSLGAITSGVMSAIERGAALEHLSKRTDTSVASLFELQKGFKAVGIDSESVGPLLFKLQKSLGGVNEYGEDTRSIFHRMGLSVDTLKKMNAPQQIMAIANGLAQLNITGASNAAGGIFGREGAAQMVQLSRSTGEFGEAMRKAQREAQNLQRNAEAFARIERGIDAIKGKVGSLFTGIAEGLAPGIQAIEDQLNAIDLTSVGERIGKVLTAFAEAFREGKLSELIALSLKTGFEVGVAALPVVLEKIGYMLLKVFETPLLYLQAGMEWVIEKAMEGLGKIPGVNKATGLKDFKADSFDDILKERKQDGLKFNLGSGEFGLDDISSDADERWAEAKKKIKTIGSPLMGMIDGLASRAPKLKGANAEAKKLGDQLTPSQNHYKNEANSFEKMGFVMGGSANPLLELNRRTASATEKTAQGINKLVGMFGGGTPAGATNQL